MVLESAISFSIVCLYVRVWSTFVPHGRTTQHDGCVNLLLADRLLVDLHGSSTMFIVCMNAVIFVSSCTRFGFNCTSNSVRRTGLNINNQPTTNPFFCKAMLRRVSYPSDRYCICQYVKDKNYDENKKIYGQT